MSQDKRGTTPFDEPPITEKPKRQTMDPLTKTTLQVQRLLNKLAPADRSRVIIAVNALTVSEDRP